jgi:hypothetical protein
MEFKVKSTCKKCGHEFTTYKRYNDFAEAWELDSETCDECNRVTMKVILAVNADW